MMLFPATVVENKMNYNEMIMERNISVQSNCEHHLLSSMGWQQLHMSQIRMFWVYQN